MILKLNLQMEI